MTTSIPVEISHLSYSSISAYQLCARSWRFKYVEKVPVKTAPALVFGSAFHLAIERLIRAYHCGDASHGSSDGVIWQDAWNETLERSDPAFDLVEAKKLEDDGRRLLALPDTYEVIKQLQPRLDDGEPVIERKVELRVPGVPVPVIGYIDCVMHDGVPVDFKTSSSAWTPQKAQAETQPLVYLAAMNQEGLDWNPELKFRHFVWVKGRSPQVQVIESQHSVQSLFWAFEMVREVWRSIEAQVFPMNPTSWKCSERFCDYWSMCRGRQ